MKHQILFYLCSISFMIHLLKNIQMILTKKQTQTITTQNSIEKQDFALNELPQNIKKLLDTADLRWLNSVEFCTGYPLNPAERVFLTLDTEKVHDALFYRIKQEMNFITIIEIIGFSNFVEQDILDIIKAHKGLIATVNTLESAVEANEEWLPKQSNVYRKDYVTIVKLPNTKDEYLNQLGKNKRRQLPRYLRRLYKSFDENIEIRYEPKRNITFEDVMALEFLNRERRATLGKGVDSMAIAEQRQRHRWALTQAFGLLVTIRHNGKIIGGTLNYLYGREAIMLVTGHDSAIDNLRIGTLGIWKTMDYLIDNHFTECNFLWGRKTYKAQFLGIEYPWSIHVISRYKWLARTWKMVIIFTNFYTRGWRFLKTRLGFMD
jgi:Acetyltransferase (GNAT) domain